jgi:hypothetical protein
MKTPQQRSIITDDDFVKDAFNGQDAPYAEFIRELGDVVERVKLGLPITAPTSKKKEYMVPSEYAETAVSQILFSLYIQLGLSHALATGQITRAEDGTYHPVKQKSEGMVS